MKVPIDLVSGPGPRSDSPESMPFIVSSDLDKADSATRRLIRSHARRGITKRKDAARNPLSVNDQMQRDMAEAGRKYQIKLEEVVRICSPLIPGRVGSDLSFVEFSDDISPLMVHNMLHLSKIAFDIICPLMAIIGSGQGSKPGTFLPFGMDAAVLHINAFSAQGFIDKVLRGNRYVTDHAALLHYHKAVRLLRERLFVDDPYVSTSDSTLKTVLKFACVGLFDGEYIVARQHLEGLRKLVCMRGGIESFEGTWIMTEFVKCDVGIAMLSMSEPKFYSQPSEPLVDYPACLLSDSKGKLHPRHELGVEIKDDELRTAWQVMSRFCSLVNLGTQTQLLIPHTVIHETMASVTYRLCRMRFAAESLNEAVRCSLLGLCYHAFCQWRDIKPAPCPLTVAYQSSALHLTTRDDISPQFIFWLLTIGAVSLYDLSSDERLLDASSLYAARCQIETWKDAKDILKSFLWLDQLDEEGGMQMLDIVKRMRPRL